MFFFEAILSASVFIFGVCCWVDIAITTDTQPIRTIWEIIKRCKKDFWVKFFCWFMVI